MREKSIMKALGLAVALAAFTVAPAQADTTIGSDVNGTTPTAGTCGFDSPSSACVIVPISLPSGAQLTSSCEGTVTRFRINGIPTADTYRLRVVHLSGISATAVSSSSAVGLTVDGVNTFPVSLPIHPGDQFGLDFNHGAVDHGVRYRQPGAAALFQNGIPDSGAGISTGTNNSLQYLFNADVACAGAAQAPPSTTTKKCKKKKAKKQASAAKKKKGCKKKKKK